MKKIVITIIISWLATEELQAQSWAERTANTIMTIWKDSFSQNTGKPASWSYEQGVLLKGFEELWYKTNNPVYFNYIQKSMDFYVTSDGGIKTYNVGAYNLDNLNNGRLLLFLFRITGKEKYWKAATLLRDQLQSQPRNSQGGFWHKKVYPNQMWLDGLYMALPFYSEYSYLAQDYTAFNDIAKQFILMERYSRDKKTGLLYHGWDESKKQTWSNVETGTSQNFWGRSVGWYAMALVDALDYFPKDNPQRLELIAILNRLSTAILEVQDPVNGLWYNILDKRGKKGNNVESSGSGMFLYALAKGVRKGYLPLTIIKKVKKGYDGIIKNYIKGNENGQLNLEGTVAVSGLGGNPYRDGSYDYYINEPVKMNDPKGLGSFLMASNEMEMIAVMDNNKIVLLDNYYNHETKKDFTGITIDWHYLWTDMSNNGFSLLGKIFEQTGVKLQTLKLEPTADNLEKASIYIIVDPDNETESAKPNYMDTKDADIIYDWVKRGGVLALFLNDSLNTEFKNFNKLSEKFGIHFNQDSRNMVKNNHYEQGAFIIPENNDIFKTAKKIYIKEICTLKLSTPAHAILTDNGDNIIAVSKVGKGMVFAVGDPWLYNEYTDGRKLPLEYENFKAANDLVRWLLKKSSR